MPIGRRFWTFTAVSVAALAMLAGAEHSPWPFALAPLCALTVLVRNRREALALSMAAASVALLLVDLVSMNMGPRLSLGGSVRLLWMGPGGQHDMRVIAGTCPRFRWMPESGRDEDGFREVKAGSGGDYTALIVGDSVVEAGMPDILAQALGASGINGRVIDTSMGGYDETDEGCIVDQYLAKHGKPSLVIVGICLNDVVEGSLTADLGGGTQIYEWGGSFDNRQQAMGRAPLFVESGTEWTEAHRRELIGRFGKAVVFDEADPSLLARGLSNPESAEALARLRTTAKKLRDAGVPAVFLPFPLVYRHPEAARALHVAIDQTLAGFAEVDLLALFAGMNSDDLRAQPANVQLRRWYSRANYADVIHISPLAMYLPVYATLDALEKQLGVRGLNPGKTEIRRSLAGEGEVGSRLLHRLDGYFGDEPALRESAEKR